MQKKKIPAKLLPPHLHESHAVCSACSVHRGQVDALFFSSLLLEGTKTWARFHTATLGALTLGPRVANCGLLSAVNIQPVQVDIKACMCSFFFAVHTHKQMTIKQM